MPRPRPRDERRWDLTPADVASQVSHSAKTVRRWMKSGQLDYFQAREGGPMRTCQEAVNDFVAKHLKRAS